MMYIPKRDSKARNLSILSIATGFVLAFLAQLMPYRFVFQACALAFIAAGVFLLQRYVLCQYRYIIDDRADGSSDFLVYRKQGEKDVKVCHISLLSVEAVRSSADKSEKSQKAARYAYNQNLTDNTYVLVSFDGEKYTEIGIECDEAYVSLIRERCGAGGVAGGFAM